MMNSFSMRFFPHVILLLISVAIGCGDGGTQKAGGQLLVDGKPVSSGSIRFYPVAGGRIAAATVGKDGRFIVSYRKPGDGLPVGEYKVAILCNVPVKDKPLPKDTGPDGKREIGGGPVKTRPLVPRIYNEIESTPLRQTVEDTSEPQNFIFDIPSKSK